MRPPAINPTANPTKPQAQSGRVITGGAPGGGETAKGEYPIAAAALELPANEAVTVYVPGEDGAVN
jgi:hypothetical protein